MSIQLLNPGHSPATLKATAQGKPNPQQQSLFHRRERTPLAGLRQFPQHFQFTRFIWVEFIFKRPGRKRA
jgi:hypothetical protein